MEGYPRFPLIVKLLSEFTHQPWNEETAPERARQFREAIEPLRRRQHLAALLVQFPVHFHFGRDEVMRLGQIAHHFDGYPLVLETRDHSWFTPPALHTVRGLGYSMSYLDMPAAWNHPPEDFEPTGPVGYLRLHGRNDSAWFHAGSGRDEKYNYLYTPPEVGRLAWRVDSIAKRHEDTYVVTNNHFEGKAVVNALELRYLLEGRRKVAAPATLVASYPHLEPITVAEGQGRLF
ncbi:MAG: DUF72 domain-containing protein [Planctomycetota bacterium]